ncbi:MAG: glucose 1-dehydrogenase [Chloroflexi bacterium]|nr:glucose 1-dehydrogenase [Chloroflexota bacterium]MCY3588315.1 glucose 1-dehydrogenase [Chloroflexota bacterium]MCY3684866.1 glucose 1-dehydrogenase [Chloroflexota bacterium]MDE2708696.1 glucose 1-dehydrogenase [Chloroflexota bacterium]
MELQGKNAVVTGAGRGIGRAIALQLAEAGARVAAADIDPDNADDTSAAIQEAGHEGLSIHADVGDLAAIDRMISEARDAFGRIDVIVNNAGVTRYLDVVDVEEADWDRIHRVNAKGVFFCMQRAAREMIDQGDGGRIINIASIAGKGYAGTSNAAYAASKGAVISMTMIAAHQLGKYNINVNAICPGVTMTDLSITNMRQRAERSGVSVDEMRQTRDSRIPIGRANDPEDIADMARFLAGPGARNITGQAFNVDGGLIMH